MSAECALKSGEYTRVLEDTTKMLKLWPNDLKALLLRGKSYYQMGHNDAANNHYRQCQKADPDYKPCIKEYKLIKNILKLTQSGSESVEHGQWNEALKIYTELLSLNPPVIKHEVLGSICKCHVRLLQADDAIKLCTQSLEIEGQYTEAYLLRAEAWRQKQDLQQAINDYNEIKKYDQQNQKAQQGLQDVEREKKILSRKDYYKIVGVPKTASQNDIRKAFRKKALELHPDKIEKEGNKEELEKLYIDLNEAYEVLSDEEKKGKYDRGEDIEVQQRQHNPFQGFNFGGGQNFHFQWG